MGDYLLGNFVREYRKEHGLSLRDFGKICGISHTTIDCIEKGYDPRTGKSINITNATISRLSNAMGVSPATLVDLSLGDDKFHRVAGGWMSESAMLLEVTKDKPPNVTSQNKIPVLGEVAAGIPIEAVTDIVDYEEIDAAMASTGEFFGLRIKGASMEPRMREGDVVIVRKQDDADTGDTAVVLVNGDSATVKKIKKGPDGISLIPTNPAYDPLYYTAAEVERLPVRIIGRVVELRAKY